MTIAADMPTTTTNICFTSVHATACTPPTLVYRIIGTQITNTVAGSVHPRIDDITTAGAASVTPSENARPMRKRKLASDRVRASNRRSRYS